MNATLHPPPAAAAGTGASDPGLPDAARLECKICWTVYDPALGDPVWQIPPGTPFRALPPHWTCPTCSAEKPQFLVLEHGP